MSKAVTPHVAPGPTLAPGEALQVPKAQFDWRPLMLLVALMVLAAPAIGSSSTWLTLTVAGLAMGDRKSVV